MASKTVVNARKTKAELIDSLTKVLKENKNSNERIKLLDQRILDQEKFITKKIDSAELNNFKLFAKIYNGTKPADVAKILEQIDERDAAIILKLMQRKKAGKVIDAMLPEHAAAILLLGSSE